ncbi:hypothetical protein H112_07951 [Trichophyton rubrum D6]|uniref:Uncharacterized protein n=2 Tax=Trichophyton TaxID=5550 RepID=A0A022VRD3_TRIRU|nr:hypothetical protein H100_07978 [Trichophyton rubrum MR850]EZF37628.1 hypothetical protein H102_07938 [Trichophyton rubrum CBS 100081]EZF48308.1 hypothetical protein H103_07963 [Trichophyton rubrum CBS 288.86]EZF58898.1 hypothetical protein H104_07910 [Trichophyton rubrum CBS 289.86]EZF80186.1 hypothetical protein H110_07962 [Trichophyton rubrum MR1448]EZF90847.1 hypothetical protein H113_08027 [Trichophyton rubrum MR1459]EZG12413.1 hypothetical protein H107_08103 [Trichophyton rubrum CBS 
MSSSLFDFSSWQGLGGDSSRLGSAHDMASTSLLLLRRRCNYDNSGTATAQTTRTTWKTPDGVCAAAEEETHPSRTLRRSLHL